MQGEISKSMGVNTRPSHKFEINGYWLMLDPNADEATIEQVQDFLYEVKKTCLNCKYKELSLAHSICWNCSELEMNKTIVGCISNWEAKQ